jgi:heptosyltransferase II
LSGQERAEHLIIQTAFLGDLLLGIPLYKELRRLYPNDKLTVLCRKGLGGFLTRTGLVDEAVEISKSGGGRSTEAGQSWKKAGEVLGARTFGLLICPHESFRSAMFAFGLKARRKIGYSRFFNSFVFSDRIARPMDLPEALRQLALLEPLEKDFGHRLAQFRSQQSAPGGQGKDGSLVPVPSWSVMTVPKFSDLRVSFSRSRELRSLEISDAVRAIVGHLGVEKKRLAVLAPGSVWPTKMWTKEGYAEVARALMSEGFAVAVMGSADEREVCRGIVDAAPGSVSIAGETGLHESTELLALADILVCNDSGSMHMAASAGVPSVSIFGPTVLDFGYRPWQNDARVVQVPKSEMPCRPCGKHGARECPLGTHACMKQVKAGSVLQEIKNLTL